MNESRRQRILQIESVSRYSNYYLGRCYTWVATPLTEFLARKNVHPNVITIFSLLLALIASLMFAEGEGYVVRFGAIILYISYVFDWCDGQLARFTGKVSAFGGWLDQLSDRTKEFFYVASIAIGGYKRFGDVSLLGAAMLALFLLFLLEYYGQMSRQIPEPRVEEVEATGQLEKTAVSSRNKKRFVIDFSIDEQYAFVVIAMLVGTPAFALWGIVLLAGLMAVYKPTKSWTRYFQWKRRGEQ